MRKIDILLFIIAALSIFSSCTKKGDAPSVADNILNYTINEIPVTTDYTVGAFYYNLLHLILPLFKYPLLESIVWLMG